LELPPETKKNNFIEDHRGYSYSYDYENRLIQIYIDDNSSDEYDTGDRNIAEFTYDALGRRIEMVATNNSVNPATSTATRCYAACPEIWGHYINFSFSSR
jgi:YD repeat-containing protein